MIKISNIKISADIKPTLELLKKKAAKVLKIKPSDIKSIEISKQSLDARDKTAVHYLFSVNVEVENEVRFLKIKNVSAVKPYFYEIKKAQNKNRPVVVGFGPGGMLCALVLARAGLNPIVIEQGKKVEERQQDIETFFKTGVLDTSSNVQFGEGGAGTFSDGKLTTGIKDFRCRFVLEEFVKYGAPKEILYIAKPHIGTDKLVGVVKNIREEIISLGGEIRFKSTLTDIYTQNNNIRGVKIKTTEGEYDIETDDVILAIGHSARNTFEMLVNKNIAMEQKPFAMGVRIEHLQSKINKAQYGEFAKHLPAADYKLAVHLPNGRSAYTFCMCPGGVVVAAASEEERLVTNGMSYFARDGKNANSALLIGINTSDFGSSDMLAGVKLQRELEHKAYIAGGGNYKAPVQLAGDILNQRASTNLGNVEPTYKPLVTPTDLREVFPDYIYDSLRLGIAEMDKKIEGFADPSAVLTAIESRSSSPVRILRGSDLNSISVKGLYPCGEGCGYAGGIMSAAVDGVKCAEAVILKCESK
jgi:hypothetical protein